MNTTSNYDFRTGELRGEPVCGYCGTLVGIAPSPLPFSSTSAADYHAHARCVEVEEPVRPVRLAPLRYRFSANGRIAHVERSGRWTRVAADIARLAVDEGRGIEVGR